ncbi:MAG: DUF4260 family protein [Chloroflexi bacterium]|nr:MAG: DUF4260 family protein [Chloroflexota bacterium]
MSYQQILLRAEGAVVMLAALALYAESGAGWVLFIALLFTPDLAFIPYMVNKQLGITVYNAVHTYLWPVILGVLGILVDASLLTHIALIWATHIGLDRMLGYGLKMDTFKDTHIRRV